MNAIYRRLHGLLLEPRGPVFVVTIDNDRWISDRYVLIHAGRAGVEAAIGNLPDGAYQVFASREPIPHTFVYGDIDAYADTVAKRLEALDRAEYHDLEATPWLIAHTGDAALRAYVRHDPDRRRMTFVNADLIDNWVSTFTTPGTSYQAVLDQSDHMQPIRVRQLRTYHTTGREYGVVSYHELVGFVMPSRVTKIPPFPIEAATGGLDEVNLARGRVNDRRAA